MIDYSFNPFLSRHRNSVTFNYPQPIATFDTMADPKPATQKKTWLASNDGVVKEVGKSRFSLSHPSVYPVAPSSSHLGDRHRHRNTNSTPPTDRAVAERSMLIKNMLEDLGDATISKENPIPIPNVNDSVLTKVIEWCVHHQNDPPTSGDDDDAARKKMTEIDEWDQKFMQVDQEMLFEIILVRITCPTPVTAYPPVRLPSY